MKNNKSIFAVALFLMVSLIGCAGNSNGQTGGVRHITQQEVPAILQQEKAVLIDVRTPGEVSEGIIKGATVFADINGSDFEAEINKLDKSKTYIVYCRSGARSSSASDFMIGKGFTKVYNLKGGISNWTGETEKR